MDVPMLLLMELALLGFLDCAFVVIVLFVSVIEFEVVVTLLRHVV